MASVRHLSLLWKNLRIVGIGFVLRKGPHTGRVLDDRFCSILQIVGARKQARKAKTPDVNRRRPLNGKIIGSNISEARDELNQLLMKIDEGGLHEAELQVSLLHAYHHLNFAWNVRRIPTSRYASLTQQEFETWGRYPSDIESFGD